MNLLVTVFFSISVYLLHLLFIPHNYVAILLVIWAAQLPYFMSLLGAVILMAVLSTIFGVIYHVHWQQSGAGSAPFCFTRNFSS